MLSSPDPAAIRLTRSASFIGLLVLAFPWTTLDAGGLLAAVVWCFAVAQLFAAVLRRGLILTMTVMISFALAYSQGLGDALVDGVSMQGVSATPEGVLGALGSIAVFLGVVFAVSAGLRQAHERRVVAGLARAARAASAGRAASAPPGRWGAGLDVGVVGFLVLTLLAAVSTGMWTYWGGSTGASESGGIRLELSYPAALLGVVGHMVLSRDGPGFFGRRPLVRLGVIAFVMVLVFLLQSRRLMISAGVLIGLGWLLATRFERTTGLRVGLRLLALAGALVAFALASNGWRNVDEAEEVGVGDRLERALDSLGRGDGFDTVESRLTYLWFDSVAHELHDDHGADLDVVALAGSEVARAIPRVLFPGKDDIEPVSCESAVEGFGLPGDLPCTPAAEGYLLGGLLGVVFAAALWGLLLGLAEIGVARGPGLASVMAFASVSSLVLLETGVFALVSALRHGLVALLVAGLTVWVLDVLTPGGRRRERVPEPRLEIHPASARRRADDVRLGRPAPRSSASKANR